MPFSSQDYQFMAQALRLARAGVYTADPNPRVGCVIVANGEVVGEGWHQYAGGPHAEIVALQQAGARARGATVYVTLEPCCHFGKTPPCVVALLDAGVARVVAAMDDPFPEVAGQGLAQLAQAGVIVETGLLGDEAARLNRGFVSRCQRKRPFVRCKLAASLDGRTAMASGESQWITSAAARADVQRLRASASAILTGIDTILRDDPRMTARVDEPVTPPVRVVADSRLRFPRAARMLGEAGQTWIATASRDAEIRAMLEKTGVRIVDTPLASDSRRLDLVALLEVLAAEQINDVMVEAGPTLSGALLAAGLIDELIMYCAPHLMGDRANPLFWLPGIDKMSQRLPLAIEDVRMIGDDIRIISRPRSD